MNTVDFTLRDPVQLCALLAGIAVALIAIVVLARRKRARQDPVSRRVRDWIEDGAASATDGDAAPRRRRLRSVPIGIVNGNVRDSVVGGLILAVILGAFGLVVAQARDDSPGSPPAGMIAPTATEPARTLGDRDCDNFATQAEAQAYFEGKGGRPGHDVDNLDDDGDGRVCERLP